MAHPYLFLTDLDGTLLTTDKKISPAMRSALTRFREEGNIFAICTGRDITSAKSVFAGLGLEMPGSFIASFNGGLLYDVDREKILHRTGLPLEIVKEIFLLAKEMHIHVQTYTDTHILAPEDNECLAFYRRVIKTPVLLGEDVLRHASSHPYKIICIELHDREKQEAFRREVESRYRDQVTLIYSSKEYLEVIPKNSGKGRALEKLSQILEIPRERTIAAGDADNDLPMILAAGTGIAMANGSPDVKTAADIVTERDNDHDGLAEVLMKILDRDSIS